TSPTPPATRKARPAAKCSPGSTNGGDWAPARPPGVGTFFTAGPSGADRPAPTRPPDVVALVAAGPSGSGRPAPARLAGTGSTDDGSMLTPPPRQTRIVLNDTSEVRENGRGVL